MCGRYGRRGDKQYIAEHYAIRKVDYGDDFPDEHPFAFAPNYNIAQRASSPLFASAMRPESMSSQ